MEFKLLIKNTSFMMVSKIAQFVAGLITTKLTALFLGITGVGIINQLNFLTQKISEFTTLSMAEAVVKQIAENKNEKNAKEIISSAFKSYIILVTLFSVISIIILLLFSKALSNYVFGNEDLLSYFFIAVFTFPLLIIGSIPFAILKGYRDIKLISQIRIGIIIINLIFAVPLIYFYRLEGAVVYVPISYLVDMIFHFTIAQKLYFKKLGISIKSISKASFRSDFVKELFHFSGFGITVGTYGIFSEFTCRSIVVSHLGINQIGLYSPIIMWASVITGFLLPALSTYLYPRFCELKEKSEIVGLLNDALRLGSIVILPLILIGIPFREIIISLFYSKEFISAAKFLPYHFLGLIFYVWFYVFAQAMTPTGRIKQHGFFQILYFSLDMLVTYYFVNKYGLYGWMLKHLISPLVFFIVYAIYSYKIMGFRVLKENIIFMGFALISSFLLLLLINVIEFGNLMAYFVGPLLLVGSFFFLKKSEKAFLYEKCNSLKKLIKIKL